MSIRAASAANSTLSHMPGRCSLPRWRSRAGWWSSATASFSRISCLRDRGTGHASTRSMAETTSDFLVKRLGEWGVRRVYGYPGDGISGIMGALERAEGKIDFIQVRHEEMAAFMACAHAKFTGEPGVCLATSGPGAIHLLNGLYDAKLVHQPVVAIVGQQARAALGGSYQQEVDLTTLFKDVASEYVHMAISPQQIRHITDRAMRIAK